ncbi:transposase family protein [Micromonospora sp. NPDC005299]|uniref:transposase family protein n=1 Tax=Micromonospora sp. NPDC005299 TaxID=3364231 RepID=UPI0036A332AA
MLPVRLQTVVFVCRLLTAERARRGTRTGTRKLDCFTQAVLILRWFLDDTRLRQLATDNTIGKSTAYAYLHEGIEVIAAQAPSLAGALLAAKMAGHPHVIIDGTLIETDRCQTPGPTPGVDLWWSGKHDNHGGNVQVLTAPDGWPLWTSDVRPGREHDTTCLRAHTELLPSIQAWVSEDLATLGDLGYEGEADTITVPIKKPQGGKLTEDQKAHNRDHSRKRGPGERGNSLLKMTFKALRNVSVNPWDIGDITRAALVLLHIEYGRTT